MSFNELSQSEIFIMCYLFNCRLPLPPPPSTPTKIIYKIMKQMYDFFALRILCAHLIVTLKKILQKKNVYVLHAYLFWNIFILTYVCMYTHCNKIITKLLLRLPIQRRIVYFFYWCILSNSTKISFLSTKKVSQQIWYRSRHRRLVMRDSWTSLRPHVVQVELALIKLQTHSRTLVTWPNFLHPFGRNPHLPKSIQEGTQSLFAFDERPKVSQRETFQVNDFVPFWRTVKRSDG